MPLTARRVMQLTQLRDDCATRVVVDDEPVLLVRQGDVLEPPPLTGLDLYRVTISNGDVGLLTADTLELARAAEAAQAG
jgi:hypothetical protein